MTMRARRQFPSLAARLRHDEQGMALAFVGIALMALLSVSMLAIDVGLVMTARNQAQNSADAGALAGAVALGFDDFNDRSSSGPAVQNALAGATANQVMGAAVSVQPGDVTFPVDASGGSTLIRVEVHRDTARGNPLNTLIGQYFGLSTADITANATAQASPANAETCVKPWTVPDRWIERQTPAWDIDDTFSLFDNHGNPLANPDIYVPTGQPGYNGYDPFRDRGLLLRLKASNGNNIAPSFYFPLALPGSTGGDDYRWNIANCNTGIMHFGDWLVAEPGNMIGPTEDGVEMLIAKDPNAYWDSANNRVVTSMSPSPRVAVIPVFDPVVYATGKQSGRPADIQVVNFIGVFVEGMQGNDVMGRIVPISGLIDGGAGPAPSGSYPRAVRLTKEPGRRPPRRPSISRRVSA